jgi:hypothetical protein
VNIEMAVGGVALGGRVVDQVERNLCAVQVPRRRGSQSSAARSRRAA